MKTEIVAALVEWRGRRPGAPAPHETGAPAPSVTAFGSFRSSGS